MTASILPVGAIIGSGATIAVSVSAPAGRAGGQRLGVGTDGMTGNPCRASSSASLGCMGIASR
jgi:hypothetical protein